MNMPVWLAILISCGLCVAQAQLDLDNIDLQGGILEGITKSNNSINDFQDMFRQKCIDVAGPEAGVKAYNDINLSFNGLVGCINDVVNFTALQIEIQDASPKGELDTVFSNYCNKRKSAMECFDTLNSQLLPCLEKDEEDTHVMLQRIVDSLMDFVCHKEGAQIALFIAEDGPECIRSQMDNIQECINSTIANFVKNSTHSSETKTLPKLVVNEQICHDIRVLELCVVRHLEHCTKITPANLMESMFNFVRNETACRNYKVLPLVDGGAGITVKHPIFAINLLIPILLVLLKMHYF